MTEKFNFEEALKAIQSGQPISGKDGVLGPLVKQLTETATGSLNLNFMSTSRCSYKWGDYMRTS